ncbi:MAG: hypothetical protein ABIO86_19715 [Sphingomonas sp.]
MTFLRSIAPLGAFQDLKLFLGQRRKHEVVFLALSLAITYVIIFYMIKDTKIERDNRPVIIYVQQWPASRTDAQIIAQQKIDGVEQTKREEAEKKRQAENQAAWKRIDDGLKKYGI